MDDRFLNYRVNQLPRCIDGRRLLEVYGLHPKGVDILMNRIGCSLVRTNEVEVARKVIAMGCRFVCLNADQDALDDLLKLNTIPKLYALDAHDTNLSDVSRLADIPVLYLSGTHITNVSPLEHTISLDISYTPVSDVSPLKNVVELNISGTPVVSIPKLQKLRRLHATNTRLTSVAQLKHLEVLDLSWAPPEIPAWGQSSLASPKLDSVMDAFGKSH